MDERRDGGGQELRRTDGTEAGTFLVKDILTGPDSSVPGGFHHVGGTLVFTAGIAGQELWKTDGTEAGTVLAADIAADDFSSSPRDLVLADGMLFFSAGDENDNQGLWRSDGTAEGTALIQDVSSFDSPFFPTNLTVAGDRLFFTAYGIQIGRELWAGRIGIMARRPELAIADLREDVVRLGLPNGIERALTAKLDAATAALGRRRGAGPEAMRLLDAFSRQVESLRTNHISDHSRDNLLEFADEIRNLLAEDPVLVSAPPARRRDARSAVAAPVLGPSDD